MKTLIALLICLTAAASPVRAQLNGNTAQRPDYPDRPTGASPGGEIGVTTLLDRINKLETLVAALQHENDLLRKKLEETKSQ